MIITNLTHSGDLYQMGQLIKVMLRLLSGRLFMNLYFWAFVIVPRTDLDAPLPVHIYSACLYAVPIVLVNLNNLVLIPTFLIRRKYYSYFSLIIGTTIFSAVIYWLVVWHARSAHPEIPQNAYSLVTAGAWRDGYHYLNYLNQWFAYFQYLTALVLIFTMAWYMRDYSRQRRLTAKLQQQKLETELRALKAQINPHFLFNTLNNLYGLALEDGPKAAEAIMRLSSVLRYSLYDAGATTVSFEAEREVMQSYINLELLRFHKTDQMRFTITSDNPYAQVAPLLGLPVLENVFKHGARTIGQEPVLDFRYAIEKGMLSIYSKNRVKRNEGNRDEAHKSGIGLANLSQRLQILYPEKHRITTKEDAEHYVVRVEVKIS